MKWIGVSALAALPIGYIAFYFLVFLVPYRWNRILAYWNPEADPQGYGFQIIQSLMAVGTGGISGLGYMEGKQKLFYLPDAHTDFIFAVVGEELGLIGTLLVLALFRSFPVAGPSRIEPCAGSVWVLPGAGNHDDGLCAGVHQHERRAGAVPNKGIPLPFLSYGGSSFVVMLAAVGILLERFAAGRAR